MNDFDDLLEANKVYATDFADGYFDGIARAGVCIVTCMDSRIEPLEMLGLKLGDAKILRTPGGRITTDSMVGLILSVYLLNVNRIMIVPHTRCAMASGDDASVADQIMARHGVDIHGMILGSTPDQAAGLRYDVSRLRSHPLVKDLDVEIGGFIYDVDTGRIHQVL
ncbi:MAG TPA: carbonic anhydrase [Propionibacterium sp.]|nr:carbonic anhydrase [Propionibacterium sp.]